MNQLIQNIKAWGLARGITGPNGKGTLLGQLSKTAEELTETRDAAVSIRHLTALKDLGYDCEDSISERMFDLIDGLGDVTVTIILAAEMAGVDFEACLQAAYDEIKGRTGKMEGGIFVKDKP
jgi:hypothetical protein